MTPIQQKAVQIIADELGIEVNEIREESTFRDDLGCDSLDLVSLTIAIEDGFNFEINEDILVKNPNLRVADVFRIIDQKAA